MVKTVLATLAAAGALASALGAYLAFGGVYDVSATGAHTQAVHTLLEGTMRASVRERARGLAPPGAASPLRGAACYREHCLQCHGGPGHAPAALGQGMQPLPGPLVDAARRWREAEVYWIVRHGIKMSGMPAWGTRLSEQDLWAVSAFVMQLAALSPADFRGQLAQAAHAQCVPAGATAAADAPLLLRQYACVGCHRIPGVTGPDTHVGPPLAGLARRATLAGRLPNTPANLARWIREPQAVKPGSAMPDLGVDEAHARQMAAFLATLD